MRGTGRWHLLAALACAALVVILAAAPRESFAWHVGGCTGQWRGNGPGGSEDCGPDGGGGGATCPPGLYPGCGISMMSVMPILVDGEPVEVPGTGGGVIVDRRTLVPVRFIAEHLGAEVSWDPGRRVAVIIIGLKRIEIPVDSRVATVDGRPVRLDVGARIFAGRVFVPVRFIGETLGVGVEWRADRREVHLSRPGPALPSWARTYGTAGPDAPWGFGHAVVPIPTRCFREPCLPGKISFAQPTEEEAARYALAGPILSQATLSTRDVMPPPVPGASPPTERWEPVGPAGRLKGSFRLVIEGLRLPPQGLQELEAALRPEPGRRATRRDPASACRSRTGRVARRNWGWASGWRRGRPRRAPSRRGMASGCG